jgi:hypothetical protein
MNSERHKPDRILLLLFLILAFLLACEPGLTVKVRGGNPPIFQFSGNDSLNHFFVCPEGEPNSRNEKNAIWLIQPDREHTKDWPSTITYGVVPKGFMQVTPKDGSPPPALEGNKKYTYHFVRGFGGGGGGFIIRDGQAVEW